MCLSACLPVCLSVCLSLCVCVCVCVQAASTIRLTLAAKHRLMMKLRAHAIVPGPATQACRLLGPVRCRELFAEAESSQHTDVLVAAQVLRAGQATTACEFLGKERCQMPLKKAVAKEDRQVRGVH